MKISRKTIQGKRPIKSIGKFTYDINNSPIVLKEKEIYNKLIEECYQKLDNLDKKVYTDKLLFKYKGKTTDEDFSDYDKALVLIDKIRNDKISFNEVKGGQAKIKSSMGEIKKYKKNPVY